MASPKRTSMGKKKTLDSGGMMRAGKDAIVVTKRHYKKHQRMSKRHYGGQLQVDEDEGNIEFVQGDKPGTFRLRVLPKMSSSMPALHPAAAGPEDDEVRHKHTQESHTEILAHMQNATTAYPAVRAQEEQVRRFGAYLHRRD